jgi:hypothetical protein
MQLSMALAPISLARRWSEHQIWRLVLIVARHGHPMVILAPTPTGTGSLVRAPGAFGAPCLGREGHPKISVTYAVMDGSPSARLAATRCWPSAT